MATRITCHENGCTKLPTFNKDRKTRGKFCGEHKKEGMVSMMYRHYNNQIDQIFKMLPEVLQWEILTEFVGGFVVRYNRLRRLMTGDVQLKIMKNSFGLSSSLWAKPLVRFPISDYDHMICTILNRWSVSSFRSDGQLKENDDPDRLRIVAAADFSHRGACVVLFETKDSGQLSYGFQTCYPYDGCNGRWYIMELDDSVVLPPYEKHIYPSYPYTNKKLGRPVLKMKLYNPVSKHPTYKILKFEDIKFKKR